MCVVEKQQDELYLESRPVCISIQQLYFHNLIYCTKYCPTGIYIQRFIYKFSFCVLNKTQIRFMIRVFQINCVYN